MGLPECLSGMNELEHTRFACCNKCHVRHPIPIEMVVATERLMLVLLSKLSSSRLEDP